MKSDAELALLSSTLDLARLEVEEHCRAVRALPISSQEDLDALGAGVKEVKNIRDRLDAERKDLVGEPNIYVRSVNEIYRAPIRAYESLETAIKDRIARHVTEQKQLQLAAQEQASAAFRAGQAAEAHRALAAAPAPAQTAGVAVREEWDAELEDLRLLPGEFWIPDLAAVRARVRATNGAPIPGVRIFKQQTVSVRRK